MSGNALKQNTVKSSRVFGDYIIMLVAPCIVALWYYGTRVLSVLAVSIATALICDFAACALLGKSFRIKDLSNIVIGAVIAMMMPASIPLYIPAAAAAFAVVAVKIPFGGALHAPFVPAAAGFAFVSVCFKEQVFSYTVNPSGKFLGSSSLSSLLTNGNSVHLNAANSFEIITGNVAGPMGTGCIILLIGCCAYLFVRRRKALLATAGFLGACALYAAIFPRINASLLDGIFLELSAGSLMFAAVFIVTDHAALPQNGINRVLYGAVCGIFCMAMRAFGTYEETVCFAVLLANGLRPVTDSAFEALSKKAASLRKGAEK
ncbi:MAG: RnfABCDGE type electron transport complex subunit D [Clostridia bacterium]|nr:RnfABCDGE type electron transport complex subunit D [Clostridia bacterium]